jgi:phosphoribosylformylglycinamidine synthase
VKVGVVVFPGSNCDRDMYHVLTDVFNLDAQYYWHEKALPKNSVDQDNRQQIGRAHV